MRLPGNVYWKRENVSETYRNWDICCLLLLLLLLCCYYVVVIVIIVCYYCRYLLYIFMNNNYWFRYRTSFFILSILCACDKWTQNSFMCIPVFFSKEFAIFHIRKNIKYYIKWTWTKIFLIYPYIPFAHSLSLSLSLSLSNDPLNLWFASTI